MGIKKVKPSEVYVFSIKKGEDILKSIEDYAIKNGIFSGWFKGIGSVINATVGYYDQYDKEYQRINILKPLEIISLIGNISLKNDKVLVHAHITLSDEDGKTYGGHLFTPTIVFAFEGIIYKIDDRIKRKYDDTTGLFLYDV